MNTTHGTTSTTSTVLWFSTSHGFSVPTPEPGTLLLVASGLAVLGFRRRR